MKYVPSSCLDKSTGTEARLELKSVDSWGAMQECHAGMWWLRGRGLPAPARCLLRTSSSPGSPSLHIPPPSLQTATRWLLLRGVIAGGVACPWETWPGEGPGSGLGTRQGILGSLVPKVWSGKGGVGARWACLHGMEHSQGRSRSARPRGPCLLGLRAVLLPVPFSLLKLTFTCLFLRFGLLRIFF